MASMKQKKWTSKEKLRIVLEGIKGQVPLGELCARNGVSQASGATVCERRGKKPLNTVE